MRAVSLLLILTVELMAVNADTLHITDEALRKAVKHAESVFNSQISGGVTVFQTFSKMVSRIYLTDVLLQTDNGNVELKNIHVESPPHLILKSINTDLEYCNMAVEGRTGPIVIRGNIIISSNSGGEEPLGIHESSFSLAQESVKFLGRTGLIMDGDRFSTVNYDIDYYPTDVPFETPRDSARTADTEDSHDPNLYDSVIPKVIGNLGVVMNRHLKTMLNAITYKYSIRDLFYNYNVAVGFKKHTKTVEQTANEIADYLLENLIHQLKENNTGTMDVTLKIKEAFKYKSLWGTHFGSFISNNGFIKDLTTINRTGNVSMNYEDGAYTLFGTLELQHLQFGLANWEAKFLGHLARGKAVTTIHRNSFFFKVNVKKTQARNVVVTIEKLHAEYLEELEHDFSDFRGFGTSMGWISKKLFSWMTGYLDANLMSLINDVLESYVGTSLIMDKKTF